MKNKKYNLTYNVKPEKITRKKVAKSSCGSCDAIIMAPIQLPDDGSISVSFLSSDAEGNSLPITDWFKVWALLTRKLSESNDLSKDKRLFCKSVFDIINAAMKAKSVATEKNIIN